MAEALELIMKPKTRILTDKELQELASQYPDDITMVKRFKQIFGGGYHDTDTGNYHYFAGSVWVWLAGKRYNIWLWWMLRYYDVRIFHLKILSYLYD